MYMYIHGGSDVASLLFASVLHYQRFVRMPAIHQVAKPELFLQPPKKISLMDLSFRTLSDSVRAGGEGRECTD